MQQIYTCIFKKKPNNVMFLLVKQSVCNFEGILVINCLCKDNTSGNPVKKSLAYQMLKERKKIEKSVCFTKHVPSDKLSAKYWEITFVQRCCFFKIEKTCKLTKLKFEVACGMNYLVL